MKRPLSCVVNYTVYDSVCSVLKELSREFKETSDSRGIHSAVDKHG